jgi:DNA-binding winged helix-turn-helix (wHTH) protein/TolB-like protein
MQPASTQLRFDRFRFDRTTGELWQGETRTNLRPQTARLLELLLGAGGEVVTRDEIRRRLWPDTLVDFDAGINTCVRQLREALDDLADTPRFIQTLPKRGYRWVASVDPLNSSMTSVSTASIAPNGNGAPTRGRMKWLAAGLLIGAGIAMSGNSLLAGARQAGPSDVQQIVVVARQLDTRGTREEDRLAQVLTSTLVQAIDTGSQRGITARPWKPGTRYDAIARSTADEVVFLDFSGAIFVEGTTVEISVRLRDLATGAEWWSKSYARSGADAGAVIDEIVMATVQALGKGMVASTLP